MLGHLQSLISQSGRRYSVFIGTCVAGAFAYELVFDSVADRVWARLNKGRRWEDIRQQYEPQSSSLDA